MRFNRDAQKSVVFLGYPDHNVGPDAIICEGTGFLLTYQGVGYLVTARHVADNLGDTGCVARLNKKDGTSGNVDGDFIQWFYHPDETVDVALTQFIIDPAYGFDFLYLVEELLLKHDSHPDFVEVGDLCYTVGLFRVLAGKQRNLPVVHTGNVARLAGEEKILVRDKRYSQGVAVDGYLVEAQTLSGLSGAPVFVRQSICLGLGASEEGKYNPNDKLSLVAYRDQVKLLGIWHAAWDAPAGQVMMTDRGREMTVPVGMGVVVPASKIVEILEMPSVRKIREATKKPRT